MGPNDRAAASSWSSRVATPPARAARSNGSPSTSTHASPRWSRCRPRPSGSAREWYFQRYIQHLPSAGQIKLFDRSWYNRAGVERVMGYCTPDEHRRFLRQCPIFERMLIEDGIILRKYWFSVSDRQQEKRFRSRLTDPMRQLEALPHRPGVAHPLGGVLAAPRTRCSSTPTFRRRAGTWSSPRTRSGPGST